jgi:hypothetical protein
MKRYSNSTIRCSRPDKGQYITVKSGAFRLALTPP